VILAGQDTEGGILSSTITVVEQVEVLPLASVAVKIMVLEPKLLQSKLVLFIEIPCKTQLSVEPLSTCGAVKIALPVPFN
jgi:hypothetical protein